MSTIVACDFSPVAASTEAVMCACCQTKKRSSNSTTCSKRCEWFATQRCAQCGRAQRQDMSFCSKACASHSVHANWCPTCTVRQCTAGSQHCSEACANAADPSAVVVQRPRSKKVDGATHCLLRAEDRERTTVANMFKGVTVMGVVQIAPNPVHRRAYLNHRAAVETRMAQNRAPKYGFGGEGNEHKRFCSVDLACAMQSGSDGVVHPCSNPSCEACQLITNGFNLQRTGLQSHYCMATADVAASWSSPSPSGLRAVCVARAVTGCAQILRSPENISEPWAHGFDSCVVSDGDATFDGTYLFSDDSIEALYIVLLM
eukprot:GILI01000897.1.p1 GENE.GILI01000897.1~~GILI01000897.1.p1  ORF type:complete len:316 (-),score=60.29 GILI01000897.1:786-1733(-)